MENIVERLVAKGYEVSFSWEFITYVVTIRDEDGTILASKAHADNSVVALRLASDEVICKAQN